MTAFEALLSLALGVVGSLVASLFWLFLIRSVKPKVDVTPHIVEELNNIEGGSMSTFSFKILNRRTRAVVDLQFELALIRPRRTKGGTVLARRLLRLKGMPPLVILGRARNDEDAHNAYRARTDERIRDLLNEHPDSFIRFRVFARDELSGIGRVFETQYHEPDCDIKKGKFARGQTFDYVASHEGGAQIDRG